MYKRTRNQINTSTRGTTDVLSITQISWRPAGVEMILAVFPLFEQPFIEQHTLAHKWICLLPKEMGVMTRDIATKKLALPMR